MYRFLFVGLWMSVYVCVCMLVILFYRPLFFLLHFPEFSEIKLLFHVGEELLRLR